jgi:heat shock protein beta
MVKRVFITSDLGDNFLPKWAGWIKVIVDGRLTSCFFFPAFTEATIFTAEDLPLNVSRETLQSTKFLKQIKSIILRRLLQTLKRIADENPEKFEELQKVYSGAFKLGAVEDGKNRDKLVELCRFATNQRNSTSLDQYVENKKQGQKQIFYLADMGKTPEHLAKSVFVEKLDARGYEVLLLTEPLDEIS